MTLPASGQISLYQVEVELGRGGGTSVSMGDSDVRNLAGQYGQISMSQFWGKSNVQPLRWGDNGSTSHGYIELSAGTFGTGDAVLYLDTAGYFSISVPNDATGGGDFNTNIVSGGPVSSYRVRVYIYSGGSYVPDNYTVYPGNWTPYYYLNSNRLFYFSNGSYVLIEVSNSNDSQYITIPVYMYWNQYA